MTETRTTVSRLERQIQFDQAQALIAVRQAYGNLAEQVLRIARERGYAGGDPLGALGQAFAPSPWLRPVGEAASEVWRVFFLCFRPDEANFEAKRFVEEAKPISDRLAALPAGGWPDPDLVVAILSTLSTFWEERHQAINQRLDQLIKELSQHQSQLGGAQMTAAHQADEMLRIDQLVAASAGEVQLPLVPHQTLTQRLAAVIGRYRDQWLAAVERERVALAAHRALANAVLSAARREPLPTLPPADTLAAQAVSILAHDRYTREDEVRALRGESARLQAEVRQLMEEVEERDRRIARYEFGPSAPVEEDQRLTLYRQAFADYEAGRDPKAVLAQVRQLERIITISAADAAQARKLLDRQLSEVVKVLHELHRIQPLTEEPKRLRPRLIFGSKYTFDTVPGQAQAIRDAARDVLVYAARARWTLGVGVLAKEAPKLQRVFKEMVALVAMWRDKLGDPPGASISIDIGRGHALVALPALLATDLDAVLKRKGRAATQACTDIVPVLEECLDLYRKVLEKAKGEAQPASAEAPKREAELAKLARLAGELTRLGGALEAAFAEAAQAGFTLNQSDQELIASDHLLLLALQQLDVACDVLAVLPGAPAGNFPALPGGRGTLDKLLAAAKGRATWLEDVARFRFQETG